ncbi:MAG TPA: hypothetical protein VJA21_12195 [Verrucomicrobiae bacterium]
MARHIAESGVVAKPDGIRSLMACGDDYDFFVLVHHHVNGSTIVAARNCGIPDRMEKLWLDAMAEASRPCPESTAVPSLNHNPKIWTEFELWLTVLRQEIQGAETLEDLGITDPADKAAAKKALKGLVNELEQLKASAS